VPFLYTKNSTNKLVQVSGRRSTGAPDYALLHNASSKLVTPCALATANQHPTDNGLFSFGAGLAGSVINNFPHPYVGLWISTNPSTGASPCLSKVEYDAGAAMAKCLISFSTGTGYAGSAVVELKVFPHLSSEWTTVFPSIDHVKIYVKTATGQDGAGQGSPNVHFVSGNGGGIDQELATPGNDHDWTSAGLNGLSIATADASFSIKAQFFGAQADALIAAFWVEKFEWIKNSVVVYSVDCYDNRVYPNNLFSINLPSQSVDNGAVIL
jgi:hypothetical protein